VMRPVWRVRSQHQGRQESIVVHGEVPKVEAVVKTVSTEGAVWGLTSSHRVLLTAEEMDPG
jgi:hypothetical protein